MSAIKTYLSRPEVMTLLFDKLTLIQQESEEAQGDFENARAKDLARIKTRLKRINVEARRAASLIETYERTWKSGHCLHCGKTYDEHGEMSYALEGQRIRAKTTDGIPCNGLKHLFESVEIETYQAFTLEAAE